LLEALPRYGSREEGISTATRNSERLDKYILSCDLKSEGTVWTDSLSTSIREPDSTLSVVSSSTTGGARFYQIVSTAIDIQIKAPNHSFLQYLKELYARARGIQAGSCVHTSSAVCFCPGFGVAAAA